MDVGSSGHNNVDGTARPGVFNRMHRWGDVIYGDEPPLGDEPDMLGFKIGTTHIIARAQHSSDPPPMRVRVTAVTR